MNFIVSMFIITFVRYSQSINNGSFSSPTDNTSMEIIDYKINFNDNLILKNYFKIVFFNVISFQMI